MGLFSKKKNAISNPNFDLNKLQLSNFRAPPERIIEPEDIREAVGLKTFEPAPPELKKEPGDKNNIPVRRVNRNEPLYIKVNIYQAMLSELEELKTGINGLNTVQTSLEHSEFNEEHQFAKLRRSIKILHDHLLRSDQILFKS